MRKFMKFVSVIGVVVMLSVMVGMTGQGNIAQAQSTDDSCQCVVFFQRFFGLEARGWHAKDLAKPSGVFANEGGTYMYDHGFISINPQDVTVGDVVIMDAFISLKRWSNDYENWINTATGESGHIAIVNHVLWINDQDVGVQLLHSNWNTDSAVKVWENELNAGCNNVTTDYFLLPTNGTTFWRQSYVSVYRTP